MKKRGNSRLRFFGGLNIFLLGLVSLLNDFSSEMILPILPMLITSLGGTGITLGLIGGLIDGLPHLLKVFTGYYSDKLRNRRFFIFLGYLNSQVFKFMLIFASGWKSVLVFTSLDKLGKGIREAPRDALIAESLPNEKGRAFGIQRAFDSTGAILGSLAVLLFVYYIGFKIKTIILISAAIGFCSLIPLLFLKDVDGNSNNSKRIVLRDLKKIPNNLRLFFVIAGIFALANFSYMFFISKSMVLFNGTNNHFTYPILLYVLFNIFYASFAIPFGKLSDEVGRRRVLLAGYFLFSLVCLGFLIFNSLTSFIILFILYGLFFAINVGVQRALVSDYAPENLKASCLGIFQAILGVSAIISSIIAGVLFDINQSYTFVYGFLMSFLAGILFAVYFNKIKRAS